MRESELASHIRENQVRYAWGEARIVHDEPAKVLLERSETAYHLAPQMKSCFDDVTEDLLIVSPYFVPGESGTAFLRDLEARGVEVRVITHSLASTDVAVVHSGYAKYRKDLLRAGVELYEMKPYPNKAGNPGGSGFGSSSRASLHAKTFVFDREHLFIGSLNLDPRSVRENTEIGVVLTSSDLAGHLVDQVTARLDQASFHPELKTDPAGRDSILWQEAGDETTGRTFSVDPETSFWRRLGVWLMGLLPVESQL